MYTSLDENCWSYRDSQRLRGSGRFIRL